MPNEHPALSLTALFTNMRTLKLKATFTIAFFAAVNHNYDQKQRTLKHRNSQNGLKSTSQKSQSMTFWTRFKVKFCFLRGPLKWFATAKIAIISWLLNFRICMFVKSAVRGKSSTKAPQTNIFVYYWLTTEVSPYLRPITSLLWYCRWKINVHFPLHNYDTYSINFRNFM